MTNAEESAFPEVRETPQFNFHSYGLTKREYFAAMALQGLLADSIPASIEINVRLSVEASDALIKALNQTT